MVYSKNKNMDYIPTDDTTIAVFDPESGDTLFLEETATDILNELEVPCDLETLLERLCQIYDATADDIRGDVVDFLAQLIERKVIIAQ